MVYQSFESSWGETEPTFTSLGTKTYPIGSMYGIYANIWGILMVNVTIYSIHGSYGYGKGGVISKLRESLRPLAGRPFGASTRYKHHSGG